MTATQPAVFLDRDGTLIEDRGHLARPEQVVFLPGLARSLRLLARHFKLFIVTNQPGVAEGAIRAEDVCCVNDHIVGWLARNQAPIEQVYFCPHRRADGCGCIKPQPFFLHQAAERHCLDLSRSFVIGDHPHDVQFARNAGAVGVYVLTGHGEQHRLETPPGSLVAADIVQAARLIVKLTADR